MENLNYFALDLRKNLEYVQADIPPFTFPHDAEEVLNVFTADEAEGKSIEPVVSKILGQVQKIGVIKKNNHGEDAGVELPAGNYFFSQVREILTEEGSAELAAEVQKEALWERRKLGAKIYLRYLYEHGSPVTQVFRELF
jgi:hypothetical protein